VHSSTATPPHEPQPTRTFEFSRATVTDLWQRPHRPCADRSPTRSGIHATDYAEGCAFTTWCAGPNQKMKDLKCQLQGNSALVTGAASGIGKEIARTPHPPTSPPPFFFFFFFNAREGSKVARGRTSTRAPPTHGRRDQQGWRQAIGVAMDVAVNEGRGQCRRGGHQWRPSAASTILVSNDPESRSFIRWAISLRRVEEDARDPLDGAFLTTRACLPLCIKASGGPHLHGLGAIQRRPRCSRHP